MDHHDHDHVDENHFIHDLGWPRWPCGSWGNPSTGRSDHCCQWERTRRGETAWTAGRWRSKRWITVMMMMVLLKALLYQQDNETVFTVEYDIAKQVRGSLLRFLNMWFCHDHDHQLYVSEWSGLWKVFDTIFPALWRETSSNLCFLSTFWVESLFLMESLPQITSPIMLIVLHALKSW